MIKKRIIKISEDVYYYEKLPNGLQVYLFPSDIKKSFSASFYTPYGGATTEFKKKGEKDYIKVPHGLAHFLEHQLFEEENGKNAHDKFGQLGLSRNAQTSYKHTEYYFYGSKNFYKGLNYLLDYVQKPYFTDRGTEKEKGIIIEEVRMLKSKPNNNLYDQLFKNTYHKHPYRKKIIGTEKDILNIKTEHLKQFYEHFYHPSQMYLIVAGNFDVKKTIKLIRDNQNNKKFPPSFDVEVKMHKEPDTVVKKLEEVTTNIASPKCLISYKMPRSIFGELNINAADLDFAIDAILHLNIGSYSELSEYLHENNFVYDIKFSVDITEEHLVITIASSSNCIFKLLETIKEFHKKFKISEESFELYKRGILSSGILMTESKINYIDYVIDCIESETEFDENYIENFKNFDYNLVIKVMNLLDFSEKTTLIATPKDI